MLRKSAARTGLLFTFAISIQCVDAAPLRFFEAERIDLGGEVVDLVSADFTGDGRDDVCVAREVDGGGQILELLAQTALGDFTIVWSWPIAPGLAPASLAVIDFDRTGGPDLAASLAPPGSDPIEGMGIFVFANRSGGFQPVEEQLSNEVVPMGSNATVFEAPVRVVEYGARAIIVADVNDDGIDDIVLTSGVSEVWAYVLNAAGEATLQALGPSGLAWFDELQFGDVDGDNDMDIVLSGSVQNMGSGSLLINNGIPFDPVPLPFEPILGDGPLRDLTGDGAVDLLRRAGGGIALMAGDGSGNFVETDFFVPWHMGLGLVKDIDGDGHLDLLGRRRTGSTSSINQELMVLHGDGAGEFDGPFFWWPAAVRGEGLATLELPGDDLPDVVMGTKFGLAVMRNRGQRRLAAAQMLFPPALSLYNGWFDAGDITGDGRSEIVTTILPNAVDDDRVEIYSRASGPFRRSAGFLYETSVIGTTLPKSPRLIDADGDGDLDVAFSSWGFNIGQNESFLHLDLVENVLGEIDPTTARNLFIACPARTVELTAHDVTGDGRLDLLMPDPRSTAPHCGEEDAQIRLIIVPGDDAGFQADPMVPAFGEGFFGLPTEIAHIGDVNMDGFDDVVFQSLGPVLLPGAADGYGPAVVLTDVAMQLPWAFVDVNDDGIIDVVGRPAASLVDGVPWTGDQLAAQLGRGGGSFDDPQLLMILPNVSELTFIEGVDLNGDGREEIVLTAKAPDGNSIFILTLGESSSEVVDVTVLSSPLNGFHVEAFDQDGDGDMELAIGSQAILGSGVIVVFDSAMAEASAGDIDSNGVVNSADLALLLQAWGSAQDDADLNNDGVVDGLDLAQLLANWGP